MISKGVEGLLRKVSFISSYLEHTEHRKGAKQKEGIHATNVSKNNLFSGKKKSSKSKPIDFWERKTVGFYPFNPFMTFFPLISILTCHTNLCFASL